MKKNTVKCSGCKQETSLISYGDGYIAGCCGKLIYNSEKKPQIIMCQEEKCGGTVNDKIVIDITILGDERCLSQSGLLLCDKCGRLYNKNHSLVFTKDGKKAFLSENQVILL